MNAYPPCLKVHKLHKAYTDKVALAEVSLTIDSAQIVALLGPNGAGKTTFINAVLGLTRAQFNELEILGERQSGMHRARSLRQKVGVMMQVGSLTANLKVREQLTLFCSYYQDPLPLSELIQRFRLQDVVEQRFGTLSGGQRQRVLFAIALCGNPRLVFLDEPSLGMDVHTRQLIWQIIRELRASGCGILLTTHSLEEVSELADQVVLLNEGRVACSQSFSSFQAHAEQRGQTLEQAYLRLSGGL